MSFSFDNLLRLITASNPIHRSMTLALINALNHRRALSLPEDCSNEALFDLLGVDRGTEWLWPAISDR